MNVADCFLWTAGCGLTRLLPLTFCGPARLVHLTRRCPAWLLPLAFCGPARLVHLARRCPARSASLGALSLAVAASWPYQAFFIKSD